MRNWGVLLTVPVILLVLASLMTNFGVAVGQDEETETPVPSGDSTLTPTPTVTATQTITTTLTVTSTLTPTPVDEIIQAETPTSTVTLTRTVTQTTSPAQAYGALPPDPILDDPHAPGELVVKITSDDFDFQGALPGIPVRSIEALPLPLTFLIKVPDRYMTASLDLLGAHPQVVYVEPNFLAQTLGVTPNDPWFPSQWGLGAIGAPAAWDISTGTAGVTIAVVDTGVDLSHPDLAGKLTAGYDFVNGDSNANDDNGHGTHVAGIAAAFGNNGTGISGVSWGALIMPVKSLAADGFGTYANVSTGIIFAADNGADIINLSLGGSGTSALLQAAVQYAYAQGVVLVAASGNTGSSLVDIPARYPEVIAVSAMTSSYAVAGFSNYGAEVDFTAPGVSILSTIPGGAVGYDSGTSMAAPFASGAIAVIMDATGITSPIGIYWLLANTARDIAPSGWDARSGYGLVRLDYALGIPPPTPTPTNEPEPDEEVTPTSGSGGGGGSLPPLAPTKTVTQILTRTPSGAQVTPTATVTLTGTLTPTLGASPTPTPTADESTDPIGIPGLVPCYGFAIIFAGLGILFYAWRLRKANQPID